MMITYEYSQCLSLSLSRRSDHHHTDHPHLPPVALVSARQRIPLRGGRRCRRIRRRAWHGNRGRRRVFPGVASFPGFAFPGAVAGLSAALAPRFILLDLPRNVVALVHVDGHVVRRGVVVGRGRVAAPERRRAGVPPAVEWPRKSEKAWKKCISMINMKLQFNSVTQISRKKSRGHFHICRKMCRYRKFTVQTIDGGNTT